MSECMHGLGDEYVCMAVGWGGGGVLGMTNV
jgi:hypothetical protein